MDKMGNLHVQLHLARFLDLPWPVLKLAQLTHCVVLIYMPLHMPSRLMLINVQVVYESFVPL